MRFESVTAHAFGPFINKSLQLAPGLNVIFGPNEAGKSRWHAALYAGLCGMRRGKGGLRKEDEAFAERHRPWGSSVWEVSAIVCLEDGRRVELRHDLDGRVDCRATDADLGRDYSNEIVHDGAPDGSQWLGLDRGSFLATACVRQADVLGVCESAGQLQEYLQRATASSAADSTAAAALDRLRQFYRDHVGENRANSTKPLRRAYEEVRSKKAGLDAAQAEHAGYLELVAQADELERNATTAERELRLVEAKWAARRVERAGDLSERHRNEPPSRAEDDQLAQDVAAALKLWEERPELHQLSGKTSSDLKAELEALQNKTQAAQAAGASEQELRDLARDLAAPEPQLDPNLKELYDRRQKRRQEVPRQRKNASMLVGAALLAGLGALALAFDQLVPGLALIGAGGALLLWTLIGSGDRVRLKALEEELEAQKALGRQQLAVEQAAQRRQAARERVTTGGLSEDPGALAAMAAAISHLPIVEADLQVRGQAERAAKEAMDRRQKAERDVRDMASRCSVSGGTTEELADGLKEWQAQRMKEIEALETSIREWAELQRLLGGKTLDQVEGEARERLQAVRRLAPDLEAVSLEAVQLEDDIEAQLESLRNQARESAQARDETRGQIEERARKLRNVPEAEEALAAAGEELTRVQQLERMLTLTGNFLKQAQDRVHRDIAPHLAASVRRWLPAVTAGRYIDVRVDPKTLRILVCGGEGHWRDAQRLSHGTAEQIYLLLRVAMAERLTKAGEVCPLLLDDVTVQSDRERTKAILHTLHAVSQERQVILFSQEPEVLEWAEGNLQGDRDRLEVLDPKEIPV